jgi:outer membrane protein OmpA-like peptidoglycan-associated protein
MNFGIYLGGNANLHSPDFSLEPNPISNSTYIVPFNQSATTVGFNFGGIFNLPIDSMFTFTARLGYHTLNSTFDNNFAWNVDGTNGVDTTSSYNLENKLSYLEITPGVQVFNLIPVDNLYLLGGLELGFPLTQSSKYDQEITEIADNSTIPDPAQRNISDGDIETAARIALAIGAGYSIRIADDYILTPEVSFRIPFTNVSSEDRFDSWSVPQIRFGINLTFGLFDAPPKPKKESRMAVSIDGPYTYDKDARRINVDKLKVEEVKFTEQFPLLPYVFFDKESANPQVKTQVLSTEAGPFKIDNLEADAMSINKSTIDIVGERLSENKDAKIVITGTTDGKDETLEIAKERAEFARDYLVVNYGVDPGNIDVKSQGLPSKASSPKNPDGIEENRRIEFSTTDASILQPITIELDRQTYTDPNLIEFNPIVTSSDSITSWNLEIQQEGRLVKRFAGSGEPKSLQWVVLPNDLSRTKVPIDYTLYAENSEGETDQLSGSIPVDYFSISRKDSETRSDKEISKFSLVVFDFDSPEISFVDKEILKKNVVPAINSNSIVQIYGYADRIGNDSYNKKLSLKRAEAVKKYLEPYTKNNTVEVYGIGENIELYDNNLPTGRQLSRTVQIYVITPKQ